MTYLYLAILALAILPLVSFFLLSVGNVKRLSWGNLTVIYVSVYAILYLPIFYGSI